MSDNNNNDEVIPPPEEYKDISATTGVEEIQSLCMNCHCEEGITKILLTKIPFFREIILLAFECPECGFKSSEVQSGGSISEKGIHIELTLKVPTDLNRQIVKMDTATITIPSLDFEIPASTQRGCLNTIEGFLSQSVTGLKKAVEHNKEDGNTAVAEGLEAFIIRLENLLQMNEPFKMIIDDPSGNSYVENPLAPNADPSLVVSHFKRSDQQNAELGLAHIPETPAIPVPQDRDEKEVYSLPQACTYCGEMGHCNMVMTDIPYFKNVVLMAYNCDNCGYKTNEIKPGGAIEPKGKILTLRCTTIEDLSRDVLKSETANAIIPEIDLEVTYGSLGGKFTTIEGLLQTIKQEMEKNPFFRGDSADATTRDRYNEIITAFDSYMEGTTPFTIIIDDPVSNSYIQNLYAPDPDPNLTEVVYERTFEQNEELGLNDINTEDYRGDNEEETKDEEEEETKEEETKDETPKSV
eukprot:gene16789-19967_t